MNADQNFTRPGAVDLSALASAPATSTAAGGGGSFVTTVTEANFEQLAQQSMRHPVVLAFTSDRDAGSAPTVADLTELVNASDGRLLLGVTDVDSQPRIAQALGVAAVPTVVALIGGQVAPLYQGTRDRADVKALLDQVIQLAVANGISGRATPVAGEASVNDSAAPAADPRFAAAEAALAAKDFEQAVAEFDKLLRTNPRDSQARAGRAQAALLARTAHVDEDCLLRAAAAPEDLEAQFVAADMELISGNAQAGFDRLLEMIRRAQAEEKEQIRVRLVELFDTMDPADPVVQNARRSLSMLLF